MKPFEKLGRFVISARDLAEKQEAVQAVMAQCIPVRADRLYSVGGIEYVAISRHFDKTPEGRVPPMYRVTASQPEEDGPIEVTFTKK